MKGVGPAGYQSFSSQLAGRTFQKVCYDGDRFADTSVFSSFGLQLWRSSARWFSAVRFLAEGTAQEDDLRRPVEHAASGPGGHRV